MRWDRAWAKNGLHDVRKGLESREVLLPITRFGELWCWCRGGALWSHCRPPWFPCLRLDRSPSPLGPSVEPYRGESLQIPSHGIPCSWYRVVPRVRSPACRSGCVKSRSWAVHWASSPERSSCIHEAPAISLSSRERRARRLRAFPPKSMLSPCRCYPPPSRRSIARARPAITTPQSLARLLPGS